MNSQKSDTDTFVFFTKIIYPFFRGKDTGLSVALFISVVMTPLTNSIVSCVMPCTCGQQRIVYASCTRLQKRWLSKIKMQVVLCNRPHGQDERDAYVGASIEPII